MANICWTICFFSPSYPFLLWFSFPLIWNSHNTNWMSHISRIRYINYLLNCWCVRTNPSSRMGNFTSQLPTMFWILKSRNFAGNPSFCTTRAYFLAANLDCSSLDRWRKKIETDNTRQEVYWRRLLKKKARIIFTVVTILWKSCFLWTLVYDGSVNELYSDLLAPVQTIFPELKIRAVVLGSRILMMTAAKRYKKCREQ